MTLMRRYTNIERLHESAAVVIRRAICEADQRRVILKSPRGDYPTPRMLARLRHEYNLLHGLDVAGVIQVYGLESDGNSLVLVEEDFGGDSLDHLLRRGRLERKLALRIALGVAETLAALHALPIVHRDIKPQNILVRPETGETRLIDFTLATRLSSQDAQRPSAGVLEGTLAYISPEQTGRMNRAVDVRSDLYSLGVTLYQLLTGELPFAATDPVELIHCHIARLPVPPAERDRSVPLVLSEMVMRLLAKAAEDRYQSAHGLAVDLALCLEQWERSGEIAPFSLGRRDRTGELRLPQRLYGRDAEMTMLHAALARVSAGAAELLLLSGSAGVGKSALVRETFRGGVLGSAALVTGKFDQLERQIPYASVAEALRQLIRDLLGEPPAVLGRWRGALQAALGDNGQVLVDLIPELGLVLGPQPRLPELGPTESRNRFQRVFQDFVRAIATAEHPLILFLDDLQWADPASLKLLETLLTDPGSGHLLVLGAYREHEVDEAHLLRVTLAELRRAGVPVTDVTLQPLTLAHVAAILSDALGSESSQVHPLAERVYEKTRGNPFFLGQFLRALVQAGTLHFDVRERVWRWDLERVDAAQATLNVVEFMAGKLRGLTPGAQRLLTLAACIGHEFDLALLAALDEHSESETMTTLWESIREDLVLPIGGDYRFLMTDLGEGPAPDTAETPSQFAVRLRFLHDRVQQAAYSLVPGDERRHMHLRIGRRLLACGDEDLFASVHHLNLCTDLITDPAERLNLARRNLAAAGRAKAATAYATAVGYCQAGLRFLGPDGYSIDHALCFALHAEHGVCEYMSGRMEVVEALFDALLSHARTNAEVVQVHSMRVALFIAQSRHLAALAAGRAALQVFGVELPEEEEALKAALGAAMAELVVTRAGRSVEALLDAPALADPDLRTVNRLLMSLSTPTYFHSPMLFQLMVTRVVNISQRHGNSELSAYAYSLHAFSLIVMDQPTEGFAFAQLALAVHERFHDGAQAGPLFVTLSVFWHMCGPFRESVQFNRQGVQVGLAHGDFASVSSCFAGIGMHREWIGDELSAVTTEIDELLVACQRVNGGFSVYLLTSTRQAIAALTGCTHDPYTLDDDRFQIAAFLEECMVPGLGLCRFYACLLHVKVLYLHGDYAGALEWVEKAEALEWTSRGQLCGVDLAIHAMLVHAAQLDDGVSPAVRERHMAGLTQRLAQVTRLAEICPGNFTSYRLLGEAELARVQGRLDAAATLYEEAIAATEEQGLGHHAALIAELCSRVHRARNRGTYASFYLREAYHGFVRWGATVKVGLLVARFPELAETEAQASPNESMITATRHFARPELFDVVTVLRAAQTIAGERVFGKIVDQLMRGVLHAAGAQRGILLIPQGESFVLEAAADSGSSHIDVDLGQPLTPDSPLVAAAVHFVARTREVLVVGDAAADPRFADDPHVIRAHPRSLACLALLHQRRLVGILYLENNAVTEAFTAERIEFMHLLGSQAASAMENARLQAGLQRANDDLEAQVRQRTDELRQANERMQAELAERLQAEREREALQIEIIAVQRARLEEMSTPLIPITDEVVVMPLIGTMDSQRAKQVLETALLGAQRNRTRVVILDITGLRHMDTHVAATVLDTTAALRLLGTQALLTGMSPNFAAMLAALDLDMRDLVTCGTLQAGIAYALERVGSKSRGARRPA